GHDPQHLLGELLEAAGWVGNWVHDRATWTVDNAAPATTEANWHAAEPVTEFIARTWCLADRLDAREPLRTLVNEHLVGLHSDQSRPGVA
ncbi:MAG TPA: hypothetical protein VH084_18835, partial [Mycobacterium sp.]|nr:hypothetical protein [Mycobacterium sp.]